MKIFPVVVIGLILTTRASAQWELYGARVIGDTVKIWNTNIFAACNAKFTATTSLTKDSIIIIERDTSTRHATCSCFYDVNVSFTGVASAAYRVLIYREQLKKYQYQLDTTLLVASFSFSTAGTAGQPATVKIQTTDCHQTPVSVDDNNGLPGRFTLLASYPNPFNPKTTISFSIPQADHVTLEVFDARGKCVASLIDAKKNAGEYRVQFDGSNCASGVYLCRLHAGTIMLTNKIVLLK